MLLDKVRVSVGGSGCQEAPTPHCPKHLLKEGGRTKHENHKYPTHTHTQTFCLHKKESTIDASYLLTQCKQFDLRFKVPYKKTEAFKYWSQWQIPLTLSPEPYFMAPLTQKIRNVDTP